MEMSIALSLHVLGITIWVGGMFFAYMALRPAAASTLEPPQRLPLWRETFARFFPWVWLSIILILASGYFIIFNLLGGFANTPVFVHIMHGLGLLMMLIFFHVFFAPYGRLKKAVAAQKWPEGGKALAQIRVLIAINLTLGLVTIITAIAGKYFIH
jgi:uncharacterized membrane protein